MGLFWPIYYLVGGWALPLWKMMEWVTVGMLKFPTNGKIGKIKFHGSNPPTSIYYCKWDAPRNRNKTRKTATWSTRNWRCARSHGCQGRPGILRGFPMAGTSRRWTSPILRCLMLENHRKMDHLSNKSLGFHGISSWVLLDKLVNIAPITWVYSKYKICLYYSGGYKPTNITRRGTTL